MRNSTLGVAASFQGIGQVDFAFFWLRWFKLQQICFQATSLHICDVDKSEPIDLVENRYLEKIYYSAL